jgi:hypothetical protein
MELLKATDQPWRFPKRHLADKDLKTEVGRQMTEVGGQIIEAGIRLNTFMGK